MQHNAHLEWQGVYVDSWRARIFSLKEVDARYVMQGIIERCYPGVALVMHAREPHDHCRVRADSHIFQGAYDCPIVSVGPQVANRCLRIGWPPQSFQAGPD